MGRYDLYEEKTSTGAWVITVLCILIGAGGWFYWQASKLDAVPESQILVLPDVTQTSSSDGQASENLAAESSASNEVALDETNLPEPVFALPALANSDQPLRDAIVGISPKLAPWLKADGLISKYMVVVNDFSQGLRLEKHMRFLKPQQKFSVEKTGSEVVMSGKSYQRYDALAAAISDINVPAAIKFYQQFRPLFLQVFETFGYPAERPLEDIFLKSAAQILAAPIIEEPIALVRPSVFYKYQDKKLEALSPVSKQMLRMGPENTRVIQHKVRELVEGLVNISS